MTQHLGGKKFNQKQRKVGLKQSYTFWKVFSGAVPVFCLAFLTAFLASSIFAPINTSNAAETTVTATVATGSYSMTLSVAENVTLNLVASPTGAMTVGSTAVSAETNSPGGYKLYLGMNSTSNDLIHSTNSAQRLHSTGTFKNPVALTDGYWGYAMESGSTTVTNGFDTAYTTGESFTPNSKKFAAVPTSDNPAQLIAETSSGNAGSPNTYNVYYGVRANYETASGTYTNTVLYTGVADAGASKALVVSPEETPAINGGDTLTLTTTMYTTSDSITANAYLLTPTQYSQVTAGTLDVSTLGSAQMSCQRNTNVTYLELECQNIAAPVGNYYIYVDVPAYGQSYAKAFEYVPNFYNITKMQEMTHEICNDTKYVTTPSTAVYNGTTFTDATEHSYPRATYADTGNSTTFRPNHLGDSRYVPETELVDDRESIFTVDGNQVTQKVTYTVRKLADGNCWMTENLALNFENNHEFTPSDTNVDSTVTALQATQSLNGTVTDAEKTSTALNDNGQKIGWKEEADHSDTDRWLSRSTNLATESSLNFSEAVQTGENQEIGTYYNWYTAVVGSVSASEGQAEADEDICPANWQLPRYTGSGSWMYLIKDTYAFITTQGAQTDNRINNILHKFPFSLPYSGYVLRDTGEFSTRSTYGLFWSAGSNSAISARYLSFDGVYTNAERDNYKTLGQSVRCVAQ